MNSPENSRTFKKVGGRRENVFDVGMKREKRENKNEEKPWEMYLYAKPTHDHDPSNLDP